MNIWWCFTKDQNERDGDMLSVFHQSGKVATMVVINDGFRFAL